MPILDIEIVASDAPPSLPSGLAQSLADAAAQVFGAPPGMVWVKLRYIASTAYAENGGKPEDLFPVFVTVLKSHVPEGNELDEEIVHLTRAIATVLNRPEANIHLFYRPDAAGRVAFGGNLVR